MSKLILRKYKYFNIQFVLMNQYRFLNSLKCFFKNVRYSVLLQDKGNILIFDIFLFFKKKFNLIFFFLFYLNNYLRVYIIIIFFFFNGRFRL